MTITFASKINELNEKRKGLDLNFLQTEKQRYEQRIAEIFKAPEWDEKAAAAKFNEAKECFDKLNEINNKIQNNAEEIAHIEADIAKYQEAKKDVSNIKSYKDSDEGIQQILWQDKVFKYAQETNNEELIRKLKDRSLNQQEYLSILEQILPENEYSKILTEEHAETRYSNLEKLYNDLFKESKEDKKALNQRYQMENKTTENEQKLSTVKLPEWMSERIKEEIQWTQEFKCLSADEIESFLLKELKKNQWQINDKHIRNKFKDINTYKAAAKLLDYLTKRFSEFKVFKETSKKQPEAPIETKNDKLVKEAIQSRAKETEKDKAKNEKLLELAKIWKIEDIKERCTKYVELFEEIWCKFTNKQDFITKLSDKISTHTHVQLDSWIQSILTKIIHNNLKPEESEWKWYLSYKLSRWYDARRIIAYPNGEIFTICQHDEYLEIISRKPPVDKRR